MRIFLTASVVCTATATAPAPSFCAASGWNQVWADEFSGPALDNSSWTVDLSAGDSRVRDSQGTADNVYLEGGALVLRSQRVANAVAGGAKFNYTSGAVQSKGLRSWQGRTRACVRAQLPGGKAADGRTAAAGVGQGIWPAHWMMPDNGACWPSNGEIDIMEMINGDGVHHSTYHWRRTDVGGCGDKLANGTAAKHPSHGGTAADHTFATAWHEYGVEYGTDGIAFALDGVVFERLTSSTDGGGTNPAHQKAQFFDVPYYMILNTAVGGPWPGEPDASTVFPTYHHIDYGTRNRVRVTCAAAAALPAAEQRAALLPPASCPPRTRRSPTPCHEPHTHLTHKHARAMPRVGRLAQFALHSRRNNKRRTADVERRNGACEVEIDVGTLQDARMC